MVLTVPARRRHAPCLYVRVRKSQSSSLRLRAAGCWSSAASGWMARGGVGRATALCLALLLLGLELGLEAAPARAPAPAPAPTQVRVSGE